MDSRFSSPDRQMRPSHAGWQIISRGVILSSPSGSNDCVRVCLFPTHPFSGEREPIGFPPHYESEGGHTALNLLVFSYILTLLAGFAHNLHYEPPLLLGHEQDQGGILANSPKMHSFTPFPGLWPFPGSHPYLYYLFSPHPTAALITQVVLNPSLAPVISVSSITTLQITGTHDHSSNE